MKKTILLLLTLTIILGVFSSCGYKNTDPIDEETSGSPNEETTKETTEETTVQTSDIMSNVYSEETLGDITEGVVLTTETSPSIEDILSPEVHPGYNPDYDPEAGKYTINTVGDAWYLVFESNKPESMFSDSIAGPHFYNSMKELNGALDTLTAGERDIIKSLWEKDENGIRIINFDNLYSPVLPSGFSFIQEPYIFWEEDSYWFYLDWSEGNSEAFDAVVEIITYEDYAELKRSDTFKTAKNIEIGTKRLTVTSSFNSYNSLSPHVYYALIETDAIYAYITLKSPRELDDADINIFLDFDFVKYEP